MNIFKIVNEYLAERQAPLIRFLHIGIIILVISQIIVSNFMEFSETGDISTNLLEFYATWLHILTGLFIIPVALIFLFVELRQHGFKYYFPYLSGEFTQLRDDMKTLLKLKLPEPEAYGLAATVQGLGLGALFLVLFSGLTWFISWNANWSWSHDIKEVHEFLTGLIQAYIVAHGGIGLLHIVLYVRSKKAAVK